MSGRAEASARPEETAMSKQNIIKISIFAISALLSFMIWIGFKDILTFSDGFHILSMAVLFSVAAGFFIFLFFVFSDWLPIAAFALFLLVFILVLGFKVEYLAATALSMVFFIFAKARLNQNIKNNLKLKFHPAILYGAPSLLTAFAALFAFASYFYPINVADVKVSPKVFSQVAPLAEKFIQLQMPAYQSGMSVDEFLIASVAKESGVSADIIKKNFKTQLAKQRNDLASGVGVSLSGAETLNDIMALVANSYIKKYLVPNSSFVPIVLAILVFLSIKSAGFILNRVSVAFAFILFKTFKLLGLLRVEVKQVDKEFITIQ
ncbi:hypothetical protein HY249_01935 [Candidatus Azambacteria bacterium]|nr:hypothetical protein [Candidatus Azambacteria bacterium]